MKFISETCIWSMGKIREENGQTIVEYALILALLVLVVVVAMMGIGQNINNAFSTINSSFP